MNRRQKLTVIAGTAIVLFGLPLTGYAQTRSVQYRNGRAIYDVRTKRLLRLETGINYNTVINNGGNGQGGRQRGYSGNTSRRTGTQTPGEDGRAHTTRRTGTNSPFR